MAIKILLNGLQFNAINSRLEYEWPSEFDFWFSGQQTVAEPGVAAFNQDCIAPAGTSPFIWSCVSTLVLPAVVAAGVALTWLLVGLFKKSRGKEKPGTETLFSALVTCMLGIHSTVANKAFQMLACTDAGLDAAGEPYAILEFDASLECFGGDHIAYLMAIFVPMMLLFVVGVPLVLFVLVRNIGRAVHAEKSAEGGGNVHSTAQAQRNQVIFACFTKGYKPQQLYWEVVVMARKVVLALIVVCTTCGPLVGAG